MGTSQLLRILGGLKDRQDIMRNIERYVELSMLLRKERMETSGKGRFYAIKEIWRFACKETASSVKLIDLVHMFNAEKRSIA